MLLIKSNCCQWECWAYPSWLKPDIALWSFVPFVPFLPTHALFAALCFHAHSYLLFIHYMFYVNILINLHINS